MIWYKYDIWYGMYAMVSDMTYGTIYDIIRYDTLSNIGSWFNSWSNIWCDIWYDLWYDVCYAIWYDIWYDI